MITDEFDLDCNKQRLEEAIDAELRSMGIPACWDFQVNTSESDEETTRWTVSFFIRTDNKPEEE